MPELEIDVDELLDLPSDVERAIRVKVCACEIFFVLSFKKLTEYACIPMLI